MVLASEGGTNKVTNGSVSIVFLKDPTDPKWRNDAAMKLYRQVMKQFAPSANANDVYHVYGMAAAWTAVESLKKAGKNLTREGLVKVVVEPEPLEQPVPAAGHRAQDGPRRPLPDRADAAPALEQGQLEELRRAVGVSRRVGRRRFPASPESRHDDLTARARRLLGRRDEVLGETEQELAARRR